MSDELRAACQQELEYLWDDLETARRNAILPGTWSMSCESVEHRIKQLTPLVGPTPWEKIQMSLLELGIYQRIHADLGIEVTVDMAKVAEMRAYIDSTRTRRPSRPDTP